MLQRKKFRKVPALSADARNVLARDGEWSDTAGLELVALGLAIPTGIELTPAGQRMAARLGRYDTKEGLE